MAKARTGTLLHFRGTPGDLAATLPEPERIPRRLAVRISGLEGTKKGEPFLGRAFRMEGDRTAQLMVPQGTPPGRYEGTAEVDGEERTIVVEVEPEVELQFVPDQLTLHVKPGDKVPVEISIANGGNVAVEIRRAYAFGIFAVGGLERALHRAYTDKRPEGERRIDYLGERLAEEHGGVVRVAVETGAGALERGATVDAVFTFHVPPGLAAGRTFTGTLPIHDVRYYVRLVVGEGGEPD